MLAFLFDSVGFGEWFILLAVVLIVVGPDKLPSVVRKLGYYSAKFRRAAEGFKRQLLDLEHEMNRAAEEAVKIPDSHAVAEGGGAPAANDPRDVPADGPVPAASPAIEPAVKEQ